MSESGSNFESLAASTAPRAAAESPVALSRLAIDRISSLLDASTPVVLVDSPPGAGKSTLVREMARRQAPHRRQVPIVVQTNAQADDMVASLVAEMNAGLGAKLRIGRLHASENYSPPPDLRVLPQVTYAMKIDDLAHTHIVIAPAMKWAFVDDIDNQWPFAIIDEVYQMRSDALQPIGRLMGSLLAVGDPGQIKPFTVLDEGQWRNLDISPIESAAATLLKTRPDTVRVALPVSWRLPAHSADLVSRAFYASSFVAGSAPEERSLTLPIGALTDPYDQAVRIAAAGGWAMVELPGGSAPKLDLEVADAVACTVLALVDGNVEVHDGGRTEPLHALRVAVGTAHTAQVDAVRRALREQCIALGRVVPAVEISTANRLQGREFDVTIVWHPLSGRTDPGRFHLDPGRMCVLLSRHRHACIIVGRAGILDQLLLTPPPAEYRAEAESDVDGWAAHRIVLDHLAGRRVGVEP